MKLKLVHPRKVVHVASAAFYAPKDSPSIKTSPRRCSYEGISLSVSNEPEYWAWELYGENRIAYLLKRKDGERGSFAFYGHRIVREAQAWALNNGWAVARQGYARRESLSEDWFLEDIYLSIPDYYSKQTMKEIIVAYPNGRFLKRYNKYFIGDKTDKSKTGRMEEAEYLRDCVNVEYVNLYLADQHPLVDGIWVNGMWHAELPSGGILPHRFDAWEVDSIYKYKG